MIAEILSTGDEIRSGALIDSNSAYISEKLEEIGVEVLRHSCVGDDINQLVTILKEIGGRSDIALVTGGLGPTTDDLTSKAAALAGGKNLVLDPTSLDTIKTLFKRLHLHFVESNRKQAMFPETAEVLHNPIGTAPGFAFMIGQCRFFFMPGVPHEMRKMLLEQVFPRIKNLQGEYRRFSLVKTIRTFGLTESATDEQLADLTTLFPDIKLGLRAKFPEIQVKLYLRSANESFASQRLQKAGEWVSNALGDRVFSLNGDSMQAVIGKCLVEQGASLALAESCTGGLISHWVTNVPGSSDYFLFSGVTYSNAAKINVLGVSRKTIDEFGAVHSNTAKEMAEGVRKISGATFGLATSGIAGPGGGSREKPVGTICIGLSTETESSSVQLHFPYGKRHARKKLFAMAALDHLRRKLMV